MKRVKETIFKEHPDWQQRQGVSGLRNFDGEDRDYDSRREYNKMKQKEWLEEKLRQDYMQKMREKQEEMDYAQQTLELNRMRGMLEDKFNEKKKQMKIEETVLNQKLVRINQLIKNFDLKAKEKKDKEEFLKQKKLQEEQDEVRMTIQNGTKLEFKGYDKF